MINAVNLKCPSCGANLEVEHGRKECFCSYCGAKIILTDDNEKTYTVNINNQAEILKAETERIELERLESEKEISRKAKEKYIASRYKIGAVLLTIGILGFLVNNIFNTENSTILTLPIFPFFLGISLLLSASGLKQHETFNTSSKKDKRNK